MSMSSLTAAMAIGIQKLKGTAATTGYIRARTTRSSLKPRYDELTAENEHTGTHQRPTVRQSTPIRSGYIMDFGLDCSLYPDLIGSLLIGAGCKVTTEAKGSVTTAAAVQTITVTATGGTFKVGFDGQVTASVAYNVATADLQTALLALSNLSAGDVTVTGSAGSSYVLTFGSAYANKTPPLVVIDTGSLTGGTATVALTTPCAGDYYEHVFTVAERWMVGWLSALHAIGDGSDRFERKGVDIRLSALNLNAQRTSMALTSTGLGITEAASSGSETVTAESNAKLSPATGSFSILTDAAQLVGAPKTHQINFGNPLAEDDHALHSAGRSDLPQNGLDVTGTLGMLDISYAIYKKLLWGGSSGTGPDTTIEVLAALDYNYQSPGNIGSGGAATPYKLQVAIPTARVVMGNFEASGAGLVRFDATYQMLDIASSAPVTVTIHNNHQHYCGS